MSCPYFIPDAIHPGLLWPHRRRLPLGEAFTGRCAAHADQACDDSALAACNVGYADCPHLPEDRTADAIRFLVRADSAELVQVQYACERRHLPVSSGVLQYDRLAAAWRIAPEPPLRALAEAALRARLANAAHNASGTNATNLATDPPPQSSKEQS